MSAIERVDALTAACHVIREAYKTHEHVYAYAIQAGENGPIKIGLAMYPRDRLKTLQTANAEPLRGLAAWRVLPLEEKLIHEDFAYAHIRGEWFHPVPELVAYVLYEGGIFDDWGKA